MTTEQATGLLTREVRIAASPDTIFDFLVDSDKMVRWMGSVAELDARPGGIYRVQANDRFVARGEYLEVERPQRVVFSFGWEGNKPEEVGPGSTRVEITLTPDGDETVLVLRHSGLPDANAVEQHGHGWAHYLGRLSQAAIGVDPGEDSAMNQA